MSNETGNGNIKPIFTRLTPETIADFHAKPVRINTPPSVAPDPVTKPVVNNGKSLFRRLPS